MGCLSSAVHQESSAQCVGVPAPAHQSEPARALILDQDRDPPGRRDVPGRRPWHFEAIGIEGGAHDGDGHRIGKATAHAGSDRKADGRPRSGSGRQTRCPTGRAGWSTPIRVRAREGKYETLEVGPDYKNGTSLIPASIKTSYTIDIVTVAETVESLP